MPKKKSYSDGYIQSLWRKAVFAAWGKQCALCGSSERVEAHHIKRRSHRVLRHDVRNGIPLCYRCHFIADTQRGRDDIRALIRPVVLDFLDDMEMVTLADFCTKHGCTRDDFYSRHVGLLKEYIKAQEEIKP